MRTELASGVQASGYKHFCATTLLASENFQITGLSNCGARGVSVYLRISVCILLNGGLLFPI